jgi:hypothetical protein
LRKRRCAGVIASHFSAIAWNSKGTPTCSATRASLRPVSWILSEGLKPDCGRSIPENNNYWKKLKSQTPYLQ